MLIALGQIGVGLVCGLYSYWIARVDAFSPLYRRGAAVSSGLCAVAGIIVGLLGVIRELFERRGYYHHVQFGRISGRLGPGAVVIVSIRRRGDRSEDRSFLAFLRAIRRSPGFWLRIGAILSFGTGLYLEAGLDTVARGLLIVLATMPIGYLLFRRSGRVP